MWSLLGFPYFTNEKNEIQNDRWHDPCHPQVHGKDRIQIRFLTNFWSQVSETKQNKTTPTPEKNRSGAHLQQLLITTRVVSGDTDWVSEGSWSPESTLSFNKYSLTTCWVLCHALGMEQDKHDLYIVKLGWNRNVFGFQGDPSGREAAHREASATWAHIPRGHSRLRISISWIWALDAGFEKSGLVLGSSANEWKELNPGCP